jgi:hypothetical protein
MKFYLIFFISFSFISIKTYIVIPFNEIKTTDQEKFNDVEELLNKYSFLNLYSEFYLGNSPYKLPVLFKENIDYFALTKTTLKELVSKDNYITSSSESLKFIDLNNKIKINNFKEQFVEATEYFHFLTNEDDLSLIYTDIEKGKLNADKYKSYLYINFLYPETKSTNYVGVLGLAYNNFNFPSNNFIEELKTKAVINSAIWSIDFPDIDEDTYTKGNIIIGELPHIYDPQYYKKDEYYKTKIFLNNDTASDWTIKTDSVSLMKDGNIGASCNYINTISINFGVHMMYAPKSLFEQLKDLYFDKLFDNRICDYKKIKIDKEKIIFVFCDKKSFNINEQKKFPKIIFNIQNLGGDLELNYKDVFMTKNDQIYLMIAFSSKEIEDNFKLGQIFLYKYKFTFDYDNKEIGFYRNDLNNEKIFHRIKRALRGKKLIIFLLIIVVCGYFLYKKGYFGKKKIIDFNSANKNITHFPGDNIEQGYELKTDN